MSTERMRMMGLSQIKALTFDVFGTLVDWRGTIVREGQRLGEQYGLRVDWSDFATRWMRKYVGVQRRGSTREPLGMILYRAGLELLDESGVKDLFPPQEREHFASLWGRLDPWPDVVPGLLSLKGRYRLVALSNADVGLGWSLARHAGLPWDALLSSDAVGAYKPDPRVYQMALKELDLEGHQVMMVAAHLFDLEGAKNLGFKTAFIRREGEESGSGSGSGSADPSRASYVDLIASDMRDFASRINAASDPASGPTSDSSPDSPSSPASRCSRALGDDFGQGEGD
jgi:2-haloacid dehalogenase